MSGRLFKAVIASALASTAIPAFAQEAQTGPGRPGGTNGPGLEEIVVTAQRRGENLQRVPISVAALGRAQLQAQGITSMADIGKAVPGVVFETLNGSAQTYIRGVGSFVTNPTQEPAVGFYIDGIYVPGTTTLIGELNDVERVEVLKGPQGTLFGRNTTGGAINMTTRTPTSDFVADFDGSYGSWDTIKLKGYVSGGTDQVAASLAGSYAHHKGYMLNLVDGRRLNDLDRFSLRTKVVAQLGGDWTATVAGFYNQTDDYSSGGWNFINTNAYALDLGGQISTDPHRTYNDEDAAGKRFTRDYGGSLTLRGPVSDAINFVSMTAYSKIKIKSGLDNDGSSLPLSGLYANLALTHSISQEFQLLSQQGGRFEWIVGAFFYDSRGGLTPTPGVVVTAGLEPSIFISGLQSTRSLAAYAQGTYKLTDQIAVTLGGRFNHDHKKLLSRTTDIPAAGIALSDPPASKSWNDFSPKLTLQYTPVRGQMVYATYSRGFKAGIYNVNSVGSEPVDPERIDAFEVGGKHDLGSIARFNWSAFYYKYRNLQVDVIIPGSNVLAQENAASTENYGLDMDLTARLSSRFRIALGASLLHATYSSYKNAAIYVPSTTGRGNVATNADVTGNYVTHAPKYTFSINPTYELPLFDGKMEVAAQYLYNDGYFFDPNNRIRQKPYSMLSGRVTYRPDGGHWSVYVYGSNLLNENIRQGALISEYGDKTQYGDPRVVGIGATTSF